MRELEFECKICGFVESESFIRCSLERAFPSLLWEEGDSSWDKIRVWGESQKGEIAFIRVYRYEAPGAFELTIILRTPDDCSGGQLYHAVRRKVLRALDAKLWQP